MNVIFRVTSAKHTAGRKKDDKEERGSWREEPYISIRVERNKKKNKNTYRKASCWPWIEREKSSVILE